MSTPTWVFPDVTGRDLLGHEYRLPGEFPAALNVAVIAFKQWHQGLVDQWIGRLADRGIPQTPHGSLDMDRVILELPVISGRYQVARRFIDGGMAASIRDPQILARTITIYGSVDRLCDPLGITSRDTVSVRVARRDGSVVWGTTGPVSEAAVSDLLTALEGLGSSPQ